MLQSAPYDTCDAPVPGSPASLLRAELLAAARNLDFAWHPQLR